VIINAASSSVGLAAIGTVAHIGGVPIAVTRNSSKKEPLRQAGAAVVVGTDQDDLVAEVLKATDGVGARFGGIRLIHGTLSGQPSHRRRRTPSDSSALGGSGAMTFGLIQVGARPLAESASGLGGPTG
jgi:threonine dehydrogenase-like Zn-dependent dehydrogenase